MSTEQTIYVSRYALSGGIIEAQAKINPDGRAYGRINGGSSMGYSPNDYSLTRDGAIQQAKALQVKKLASLRKQIEKLEKKTFN